MLTGGALGLLLVAYGAFLSGRPRSWPIHRYARWLVRAPIAFGVAPVMALALLGRLEAIRAIPPEFSAAAAMLRDVPGFNSDPVILKWAALGGLTLGAWVGLLVAWRRVRRGRRAPMVGDLRLVLPRSGHELPPAGLVAVLAGVLEELYFRLALPLAVAVVSGSAVAGFAVSAALFTFAHRYQRWSGMVATGLAGLMQTGVYLMTGSLPFAMLVHAIINLNALVLRPALLARWQGKA